MNQLTDYAPTCSISSATLLRSAVKDKFKDIIWTSEIGKELPIMMTKEDYGGLPPETIMQFFEECVQQNLKKEALHFERNGKWTAWTWNHFHKEILSFAKALINIGVEPYRSVNILAFNSPEWATAFFGGIYGCVVPCGIYLTNNSETCLYMAEHSECGCLVIDSIEQYKKYEKDLDKLKHLKVVVFTIDLSEEQIKSMVNPYVAIYQWKDFIEIGRKSNNDLELNNRIKMQNPGNCCNIVYTSGTTGQPKGVLLSHDNMTWVTNCWYKKFKYLIDDSIDNKTISFLPLSHIAGQFNDLMMPVVTGGSVYFARPDALSGSILQTLLQVKPTIFFAVPRVYEKIEQKIRDTFNSAGYLKQKLIKFGQKTGTKYVENTWKEKSAPLLFPLAKVLVLNKIKKALGFDVVKIFCYGAAPMKKSTLDFFKSLGIVLHNIYGMSECTGPNFTTVGTNPMEYVSAGNALPGTDGKILNPDKDGVGEICFRGRNRFMGYYKNEASTLETIDAEGFIHSGDQGYINKNGNLFITGRFKELLVTAGGENVAPIPIEDSLKEVCSILSYVVVLGDDKKYLAALLTLKTDPDGNLIKEVLDFIREMGSEAITSVEAVNCDKLKFYIQKSIDEVNKKASSRAQWIRRWTIIPNEFSIDGGELTPTLKLKRKLIAQKYSKVIDKMYTDPKF